MDLIAYLGENSYPSIVKQITEKIRDSKADTEAGNEYLSKVYDEMNSSDTPMLVVKNFIKNCTVKNDPIVNDVVDFCKTTATENTDLNYLINLCREEHIQKLIEIGIDTEAVGDYVRFNQPSNVIKESILNGVYDDLKYSALLNTLKNSFGMSENKIDVGTDNEYVDGSTYRFIVSQVKAFIETFGATDTIQGTNLVNGIVQTLSKTRTPLLVIRDFIVEGLKTCKTYKDIRLEKFIEELQEITASVSMNYLINICREEEIRNKEITGHNIPVELTDIIDDNDEDIKKDVIAGIYNNYNSKLLNKIKKSFGIVTNDNKETEENSLKNYLGPKSYISIVDSVIEKIRNAEVGTIAGNDMISQLYHRLNESKTPMLDVKQFITNAEEVAKDDASLAEVIEFCKKQATNGDLNYIINLCKEEHFENLCRSGHPSPEKTIEDIESRFKQPASIIEQAIKKGIFDKLNSKLLNEIKTGLNVKVEDRSEEIKKLDESYQYINGGYAKYCPIGVLFEDSANNRVVALCESDILSFDKTNQEYSKITDNIEIPHIYNRLMEAIQSLSFNPDTEVFSLNEEWDFIATIHNDGTCYVGLNEDSMKEIDADNMRKLLFESIQEYRKKNGSSCNEFVKDADNFMMLFENYDNIVKFDNLHVIRNLNEGTYAMIDTNDVMTTSTPKVLSINGSNGKITANKRYDSFIALCESVKENIGKDCEINSLFETEIRAEHEQLNLRREKMTSLMEKQKEINVQIEKVKNLKNLAESDSPAMDKLNQQHNMLLSKLNENIDELNFYTNDFKLHP